jgi:hypothetical protein
MSEFSWETLNKRRRVWAPNNPPIQSETSLAPKTISRCLALTSLEPLVSAFITEGLDKADKTMLGNAAIATLQRNIEDETKHELALNQCKAALTNYSPEFEYEADQIIKAWAELPDNEITKAAVLENGVFFVVLPIYSTFGSCSLRISANSISGDEIVHVQSHRRAAQLLKAKPSKQLDNLREYTVEWLSQDIAECRNKNWTQERCIRNSESLMKRGVSDLLETRVASVNAPFELRNTSLERY